MQPPLIFTDSEYTNFGPSFAEAWPEPHHYKEIYQVAAVRIDDDTFAITDKLELVVRPTFNSTLSTFATQLTGMTQARIDTEGITFVEALEKFVSFCGDTPIVVMDADWSVWKENCRLNKVRFPYETNPFIRVKEYLGQWGVDSSKYSSGTLHKAAGIEIHGKVHDPMHDVQSLAAAVNVLSRRNSIDTSAR